MTTRRFHADRIISALPTQQRAALAADPVGGITALGYTVVPEPALTSQRGAGGMCDGLSFAEHNTVMYAPTAGSKRGNFTLLHEVAHILVENDDEALVWLADRDDPDVELERLCEHIAAALLVPDELVDDIVGTGPVTANDLRRLVAESSASGPACAIALATRLPSPGAVVIIDRATSKVVHSSLRGELAIYPWKGTEVPVGHPLTNLQVDVPLTTKSFWANSWGRRETYYLSAVATEKRTYAVLSQIDLWSIDRFHGGQVPAERSNVPRNMLRCPCGFSGPAPGWPCNECRQPYCPRCGDCACDRRDRAQQACTACFCLTPAVDLVSGVCSGCR